MLHIVFKGQFYGLNEYIKAINSHRFSGAHVKTVETQRVYLECRALNLPPIKHYPVTVHFKWFSINSKKDIDNVAFAKKFILDGLVLARVLTDDSRKYVAGFTDTFFIDKENPRVEVDIIENVL